MSSLTSTIAKPQPGPSGEYPTHFAGTAQFSVRKKPRDFTQTAIWIVVTIALLAFAVSVIAMLAFRPPI